MYYDNDYPPDQDAYGLDDIHIEMKGIMEIYLKDDLNTKMDLHDFKVQERQITDDFFRKHNEQQGKIECLVCGCTIRSFKSLKDHVDGQSHTRKACEKKKRVLGIKDEPQNAPRKKKAQGPKERVDINLTLKQRFEAGNFGGTVGLVFIKEYVNPNNLRDHPIYECTLPNCKSAWGNSDDMYRHVKNFKHQRNYFYWEKNDESIMKLNKNDLMQKVFEQDLQNKTPDLNEITQIKDADKYKKIKSRTLHWKEGDDDLDGGSGNANHVPLGKRDTKRRQPSEDSHSDGMSPGGRSSDRDLRSHSPDSRPADKRPRLMEDAESENWEWPKCFDDALSTFVRVAEANLAHIKRMIDAFDNTGSSVNDEEERKYIQRIIQGQEVMLALMETNLASMPHGEAELAAAQLVKSQNEVIPQLKTNLEEMEDAEFAKMKGIQNKLLELENEMKNYLSSRDSNMYANYKIRCKELISVIQGLNPTNAAMKEQKIQFNDRLGELYKLLEDNSDTAEMLTNQPDGEPRARFLEAIKNVTQRIVEEVGEDFDEPARAELVDTISSKVLNAQLQQADANKKKSLGHFLRINKAMEAKIEKFAISSIEKQRQAGLRIRS